MFGIAFKYDDNWILEHFKEYPNNTELCKAYNSTFGTDYKINTFKSHLAREMGLGGLRNSEILYTKDQEEFLRINYPLYGQVEVTRMFNEQFNTDKTVDVIKTKCKKMKLTVCESVRKQHHSENIKKVNERDLGEIWMGTDGFLHIKVSNEPNIGQKAACPRLHRYVWENHNGEIPKNHRIIFLDGDITNCNIENLACVPLSHMALMNKYNLRSENREITMTAIKWCDLYTEVKKR